MSYSNPFEYFADWFKQANNTLIDKPNAMVLSTISDKQSPASRVVLLSSYDSEGFVFHTNYNSHKASHLLHNHNASLLFWWDELGYQIRIEGRVEKTSNKESDEYFAGRLRGSQIGAWSSNQSSIINGRAELEEKVKKYSNEFKDQNVKRPDFWGGYRLIPDYFEFWINRESRLHDRIEYRIKNNQAWTQAILAP